MSDPDVQEAEEFATPRDTEEFAAARAALEELCANSEFTIKEIEGLDENDIGLEVAFPSGRHKRFVYLYSVEAINDLLSIPFERYIFLDGYAAICSYEDREVEALIRPLTGVSPRLFNMCLFGRPFQSETAEGEDFRIILECEEGPDEVPLIVVGPISRTLQVLGRGAPRSGLSLTLRNASVSRHDQAVSLVQGLLTLCFFKLSCCLMCL